MRPPWLRVIAKRRGAAVLAAVLAAAVASCGAATEPHKPGTRPTLGLMTTLPLVWGETGSFGDLLTPDAQAGWVRPAIEAQYALEPLDTLEPDALAKLERLMLAQPRALAPDENVALDAWVRAGGRLLLFADPMLTRHSRFAVGDRRRPQDVVLLSPILRHWGLDLRYDDEQPTGETTGEIEGITVAIDKAGSFAVLSTSTCRVLADGLAARCRIGKGEVLAVADAALLDEPEDGHTGGRRDALTALFRLALH